MSSSPLTWERPAVPVTVTYEGRDWPGFVLCWWDENVFVEFSVGVGMKHMLTLHASSVARLCLASRHGRDAVEL